MAIMLGSRFSAVELRRETKYADLNSSPVAIPNGKPKK